MFATTAFLADMQLFWDKHFSKGDCSSDEINKGVAYWLLEFALDDSWFTSEFEKKFYF